MIYVNREHVLEDGGEYVAVNRYHPNHMPGMSISPPRFRSTMKSMHGSATG